MKLVNKVVEEILIDIINRTDMPQIKGDDISAAIDTFKKYGIPYEYETVNTKDLIPIQNDFIQKKVDAISNEIIDNTRMNPIFISDDNYIIDGHHRWLAYNKLNIDKIECIKVKYPKMAALRLFDKVSDKLDDNVVNEKYLTRGKIFKAIHDLDDLNIKKGDSVELLFDHPDGYFDVMNLKNKTEFRIHGINFVKHFR